MFRRYIQNAGTSLRLNNFGGNIARHYCHIYDDVNDAVQKWIQTLSEIDSKKIRYFLNEVGDSSDLYSWAESETCNSALNSFRI